MSSTISVSRDSGYADRVRDYRVMLDGAEIGRIGNGGEKSFEIAPGHHQLVIKVDYSAPSASPLAHRSRPPCRAFASASRCRSVGPIL